MKGYSQLVWLPTGGHIGDAVMVTSLFSEIIRTRPDLKILYLVRRNAAFIADLARAYPCITVVPVPHSPVKAFLAVLPIFRARSIVIVPPAWGSHPLVIKVIALLAKWRGDMVVGFTDRSTWQPYTEQIAHDRSMRYIDNLRAAARLASFGTAPLGTPPHLDLISSLPGDFPFTGQPYFVLHPFPHMATSKTMPLRRWSHLVQELRLRYPDYGVVITGALVDADAAREVVAGISDAYLAIDRPLGEVAGLMKHAALYIGVDTGPTHIAGVMHVPSVVLAQQNEPMWLPTYNPNAVLIWEKKNCVCGVPGKVCSATEEGKSYRRCVYDISDEMILGAVSAQLHANH